MARDRGKQFEDQFRKDWLRTFPDSFLYRLPDQQSRYKNESSNPCDFFCHHKGILFMIECKSHKGASIPFTAMPQYDRLLNYEGIEGIRRGFIIWLYEKDWIRYVPESTVDQMVKDGEKSVGIRSEKQGYKMVEIPSEKLRVMLRSDYHILLDLKDGE